MIQPRKDIRLRLIGALTIQSWLLLLGLFLVFCGADLGGADVLDHHEIDVAGGARQMIAEGDWLTPKIGDHLWLEKPPLLHWLVACSIILFGQASEWVVRLPSVASGLILVILMATMVGRWKGEKAGLVAGFIQCTSFYVVRYACLAEAETLLACIVTSAIAVFIHLQGIALPHPSRRPRLWAMVFWVLAGLTNLCKGPLFGAAMTLMPCLAWLLWRRERGAWKKMWSPIGLVLGVFIAAAWPTLVLLKVPSALDLWLAHTVGRAIGTFDNGSPWWLYLKYIPLELLPWTFVTLIGTIPSLKRMWKEADSADRFTWLWVMVPIALLSLSHGKKPYYMMSCLPGFTLVTTIGIFELKQHILARTRSIIAVSWVAIAVLAPLALLGGLIAGFRLPEHRVDAWMLGVLFGVGFMLAGVFTLKSRPGRVFAVFLFIFALLAVQINLSILPPHDTRRHDRLFLTTLQKHLPPQSLLFATGGPRIARHIFYVQVPLIGVWEPEDIGKYLGEEKVFFVVGLMEHLKPLECYGTVTILSQSEHTYKEKSLQDRYTLFRVQRPQFSDISQKITTSGDIQNATP